MKKVWFDEAIGIPSYIDVENNEVYWDERGHPDYSGIRLFQDIKQLYAHEDGMLDEEPMYFTCGRVALEKDRSLFYENHVAYEYTVIPAKSVRGECNKTYGHIHGVHPKTGKRRLEAFEILNGTGGFQLFKEREAGVFDCLCILLEKGDRMVVPSDYFHLSFNDSKTEPFIFADLIKDDVETVYSYVKEKNGAPYRVFYGENTCRFQLNEHWKDCTAYLQVYKAKEIPCSSPLTENSLYAAFVREPKMVTKLLEG